MNMSDKKTNNNKWIEIPKYRNISRISQPLITLEQIEEKVGGLLSPLLPEDKIYIERIIDGIPRANVTNLMEISNLIQKNILFELGEILDDIAILPKVYETSNNDIDCSTIDRKYNVLSMTSTADILVYNIEQSNIRYFYTSTTKSYNISSSFSYRTISDIASLISFYSHDKTSSPFFQCHYAAYAKFLLGTDDNLLALIQQDKKTFYIRFSKDLTMIREYFNTDEFLIPFSYSSTSNTYTYDADLKLNIHQPTTKSTGTELKETAYQKIIYATDIAGVNTYSYETLNSNYLLNFPIHSPCLVTTEEKKNPFGIDYLNLYGEWIFTLIRINTKGGTGTETSQSYILKSPTVLSQYIYHDNINIDKFIAHQLIKQTKVLNCEDLRTTSNSGVYISHTGITTEIFGVEQSTTWADDEIRTTVKECLTFYTDMRELHALTNISLLTLEDDDIPTGYITSSIKSEKQLIT